MAHEEPPETTDNTAFRDAERRELLRQRLMGALQPLERLNHVLATGELRTAPIRAELTLTREPRHDDAGEQPEHDLGEEHRDEVRRAAAVSGMLLELLERGIQVV